MNPNHTKQLNHFCVLFHFVFHFVFFQNIGGGQNDSFCSFCSFYLFSEYWWGTKRWILRLVKMNSNHTKQLNHFCVLFFNKLFIYDIGKRRPRRQLEPRLPHQLPPAAAAARPGLWRGRRDRLQRALSLDSRRRQNPRQTSPGLFWQGSRAPLHARLIPHRQVIW